MFIRLASEPKPYVTFSEFNMHTSKPMTIQSFSSSEKSCPQEEVKAMRKALDKTPAKLTNVKMSYHIPAIINKQVVSAILMTVLQRTFNLMHPI